MERKNEKILYDFFRFDEIDNTTDEIKVKGVLKQWNIINYNLRWYDKDCLNDFINEYLSTKNLTLNYQHCPDRLIGRFIDIDNNSERLYGVAVLDKIPFVSDTVIPQLNSGTLQGFSTEIYASDSEYEKENGIWIDKIYKGVMGGCALVGMPADLNSNLDNINQRRNKSSKRKKYYILY
jgi:hypothetical protein